jgi:hypothetical protein
MFMRLRAIILLLVALALSAGVAVAKRSATKTESAAIYKGLPKSVRKVAQQCWKFTVSTADKTWSESTVGKFAVSGPCAFHGVGPGAYYLHESHSKWKLAASGTGFTCGDYKHAKMPTKVIKDLTGRKC